MSTFYTISFSGRGDKLRKFLFIHVVDTPSMRHLLGTTLEFLGMGGLGNSFNNSMFSNIRSWHTFMRHSSDILIETFHRTKQCLFRCHDSLGSVTWASCPVT